MSRLVAVSNRISVPEARRRARRTRRGVVSRHAGAARHVVRLGRRHRRDRVRRAVDGAQGRRHLRVDRFRPGRVQGFLSRLLQRHAVAAVPLFRRRLSLQRRAVRSLPAHEPALCAAARADARAGRPGLGARLSPVPAGAETARGRGDAAHGPVPAHSVSAHRSAARAAGVRRAAAGDAGLRRARVSDRARSRCVPLGGGVGVGRAGARPPITP